MAEIISIYESMTTEELKEKERELYSLIESARETLDRIENELFYRKYPECKK